MYSELRTYTSMSGFIQAHEGLWYMLGAKYKKLNKETVVVDNNIYTDSKYVKAGITKWTTWKLVKGKMICV